MRCHTVIYLGPSVDSGATGPILGKGIDDLPVGSEGLTTGTKEKGTGEKGVAEEGVAEEEGSKKRVVEEGGSKKGVAEEGDLNPLAAACVEGIITGGTVTNSSSSIVEADGPGSALLA